MLFTLTNKKFFDSIENMAYDDKFSQVICELLPPDWTAQQSGVWLSVSAPSHKYPEHGFKIHVSGTASNATEVIARVAPICFAHDTPFKTARDPAMFSIMSSKHYPRGNAGKLMTIYPRTHEKFLQLIKVVHEATLGMNGPYILSDRRYGDAGIVYYRYGEFLSHDRLSADGSSQSELIGPNGERYAEARLPYYQLPPWVSDPFVDKEVLHYQGEHVLNGRYQVEKSLNFTNAGGIYLARDLASGNAVVLKEARPHTAHFRTDAGEIDAVKFLEHEFTVLSMLQSVSRVVRAVELFSEWEHRYLVEDYVPGIPLTQFRARNDVLLCPFDGSAELALRFCRKFTRIAEQLIEVVCEIHQRGIVIGDLSPNNILIDPDSLEICLIDFESAYMGGQVIPEALAARWATPGYGRGQRTETLQVGPDDDWYALGMVLYSFILPMQVLFDLDKRNVDVFLDTMCEAGGLPSHIPEAIRDLLKGDHSSALARIVDLKERVKSPMLPLQPHSALGQTCDVQELLAGIDAFLDVVCQPDRDDRLWPGDPATFSSNAISLAYGAGGPLLYRAMRGTPCTTGQRDWLERKTKSLESLPPGLYTGLAGLAIAYAKLGESDRGISLLNAACRSNLLGAEASLFQGDAGVLLACLLVHEECKDARLLDWASQIADGLLSSAQEDDRGIYWQSQNKQGKRELGLAFGGSGVALALLYFGLAAQNPRVLNAARGAIEAEIGLATERDGRLYWGHYEGSMIEEPYWLHGSSGVGSVLIRFAVLCNDSRFELLAQQAADVCYSRFAVLPGQVEGMSGIGEFMLDLYQFTGKAVYRQRAEALAQSIALYRVDGARSIAFPGRGLQRLSCDYAYGASGIGMYLHRLTHGGPRMLHDLPSLWPDASVTRHWA